MKKDTDSAAAPYPSLVGLLPCVVQGLQVSLRYIPQNCVVLRQISCQLLQQIVLLLKHIQSLCLGGPEPAVLPSPQVVGMIRDRQLHSHLTN
jgi:hypothetical protein